MNSLFSPLHELLKLLTAATDTAWQWEDTHNKYAADPLGTLPPHRTEHFKRLLSTQLRALGDAARKAAFEVTGETPYLVEPLATGFFCRACGTFTGDAKCFYTSCRWCGAPRPREGTPLPEPSLTSPTEKPCWSCRRTDRTHAPECAFWNVRTL